MPRPKLEPSEKKVNVSFTLTGYDHDRLIELVPPGHRSMWIGEVVTKALNREERKK